MGKMTKHDAIIALLGIPETHLSTEKKASIIELLCENTVPYYIYTNYSDKKPDDIGIMYTSKEYKGTDNPEMYDRPPNSYISNSSSCG